jgi:hypothetical protein
VAGPGVARFAGAADRENDVELATTNPPRRHEDRGQKSEVRGQNEI